MATAIAGTTHASDTASDYQLQSQCAHDARDWFHGVFMENRLSQDGYVLRSHYKNGSCFGEVHATLPYSNNHADHRQTDMEWVYEVNSNAYIGAYSRTLTLRNAHYEYDNGIGEFEGKQVVGTDQWEQEMRERTGLTPDYSGARR
jgi:hypothetical protein